MTERERIELQLVERASKEADVVAWAEYDRDDESARRDAVRWLFYNSRSNERPRGYDWEIRTSLLDEVVVP